VFEYFVGYKLGLTATPKDYLKRASGAAGERDPRETERRMMIDTYRTFGCESGDPTFRYSLLDGVREGFLINPYVVDARTGVTTQLLSEQGYVVSTQDENGGEIKEAFAGRDFEKRFFAEPTNLAFCKALMQHGLRDPVTGEFGKTIAFAVSQNHAAKIVQILNQLADQLWPGRYNSDFAMQVTSDVVDSQKMTVNFANNNLGGHSGFLPNYRTCKARVCVTVGMMTTGYDCPDLLNLALMRPVFSPSEFVQMKGRGTRKHNFAEEMFDPAQKAALGDKTKTVYRLLDFFANCEFFEETFRYDEELNLPRPVATPTGGGGGDYPLPRPSRMHEVFEPDEVVFQAEQQIGVEGMRVDRELFQRFEDAARSDAHLAELVEQKDWDAAAQHVVEKLFEKPIDFFNLDKLRRATGLDRRISIRELIEKAFGFIPKFKSKAELIDDEFQKFLLDQKPDEAELIAAMRYYFESYIQDAKVRQIIDDGELTDLNVNPTFNMNDLRKVPERWRKRIPEYVKDYVPLNPFL
jgi:type I restriction enzyme R subunit